MSPLELLSAPDISISFPIFTHTQKPACNGLSLFHTFQKISHKLCTRAGDLRIRVDGLDLEGHDKKTMWTLLPPTDGGSSRSDQKADPIAKKRYNYVEAATSVVHDLWLQDTLVLRKSGSAVV